MKQEEKQILLQDLCARLPYGVHLFTNSKHHIRLLTIGRDLDYDEQYWINGLYDIDEVRPYLRTMSSMTEEEKSELLIHVLGNKENTKYFQVMPDGSIDQSDSSIQELSNFTLHWLNFDGINTSAYIDWLNAHHFDFRGMIEKGLAIEASKEMYKTE